MNMNQSAGNTSLFIFTLQTIKLKPQFLCSEALIFKSCFKLIMLISKINRTRSTLELINTA